MAGQVYYDGKLTGMHYHNEPSSPGSRKEREKIKILCVNEQNNFTRNVISEGKVDTF